MRLEAWSGSAREHSPLLGKWLQPSDARVGGDRSSVTLVGNSRAYYSLRPQLLTPSDTLPASGDGTSAPVDDPRWQAARYDMLHLNGRTLRWIMDLSNVPCGCNAAIVRVVLHGLESPLGPYIYHTLP